MAKSAILPVRRTSAAVRFPGPLLALALLPVLAGAAAARVQDPAPADAPVVSMDRLRFEFKCYFGIAEWQGKGEEFFLGKLVAQKAAYKAKNSPDLAALEGLMAQAYWDRKTKFEKDGDADRADEMAGLVLMLESRSDPVVKGFRDQANAFVIQRNYKKAQALEAGGKLDEARKAFRTLLGADDAAIGQQAVSSIVRIVRTQQNYDAILATIDLVDIGTMLDAVMAELRKDLGDGYDSFLKGTGGKSVNADLKSVDDKRLEVAGSTQNLAVAIRDVSAALAGYAAAGGKAEDASKPTFRLEPEGEGKPFPPNGNSAEFKKVPFKWYRGVYTVKAFVSKDAKRPFAVLNGIVAKDAPGAIEVPNRAPEGMVWVPPLKAGGDALFIDRYEVTVAQVEAVSGSDETLAKVLKDSREAGSDPNLPAYFAESSEIGAYETKSGKRSPTADQWLQAAFQGRGIAERPFPWGSEPPDSTRVFAKATGGERPEPVGGRPAGAAACGAEDMVGNLCEWVRKDGQYWVLGGYWSLGEDQLAGIEGHLPAREPMPQIDDFNRMSGAQQTAYGKFKFDPSGYYLCGLRTVIPVPAK